MSRRIPKVAILGRTNVGKSTLFNSLIGAKSSIVEDMPGVTRDRVSAVVRKGEVEFELFDTGGLFGDEDDFAELINHQAELALKEASLVLVVLDALHGLHALDHELAKMVRGSNVPALWIANKTEKDEAKFAANEFYELGIEEIIPISAVHREGTKKLLSTIENRLIEIVDKTPKRELEEDVISVAIIGRPNVGKSSLVNRLLGEQRVIASDVPGTTRDSIDIELTREGQKFCFIDTAGLRKKARIPEGSVERFSALRTLRALARADVALLLLDAENPSPLEQDQKIAALIDERGIPVVLAVNKWDLVEKDHRSAKQFTEEIFLKFPFLKYAPLIFISALTGKRCPNLFQKIKHVHKQARKRIQTADLNRHLERAFAKNPPPVHRGRQVKMFFATQVAEVPPRFLLFMNFPKKIGRSYERYLVKAIRDLEPYEGVSVKIEFRKRRESRAGAEQAESSVQDSAAESSEKLAV